jgi:hypothetical protein
MQDVLDEAPARLVVEFTHEVDQTRVDATTLRLERLDADAGDGWTPWPADLAVPTANPSALIVTPRGALSAGRYRLVATGSPGPMLSDRSGQALPADGADGANGADATADRTLTRFDIGAAQ